MTEKVEKIFDSAKEIGEMIPKNVIIPCPAKGFSSRRANKCCPGCCYFGGLLAVQEPATWPKGYRVNCSHPVARRVTTIED